MLGQHSSIPTQSTGPVNGQTTPTAQSNLPGKLPSNLLFRVNAVLLMVTSRGAFVSSDLAGALKFVTSDLNSHEGKTGVVSNLITSIHINNARLHSRHHDAIYLDHTSEAWRFCYFLRIAI
ncbi:hypothetical protein PCANC_22601 [Puccinia coronata f. sp. avenae]|uniref:Uncharacterized protein n=1 Tax=Puccinia coronata f. sp. avenae TaxID=200324 RepID=A0A2N5SM60_9BASI|nr:hypothetical protein PCANC_22601 [Puccinia coronata f. sp. avenae]